MLLIGTRNITPQAVLTDGIINIGGVYRRYCKRTNAGLPTFNATANGITLNGQGMYHITATFVATGTTTGDVTIQATENDIDIIGATASEAITVATTQPRTLVLDFYVLVDNICVLGQSSTNSKTIAFTNTGIGATFTNVIVNAEKVV